MELDTGPSVRSSPLFLETRLDYSTGCRLIPKACPGERVRFLLFSFMERKRLAERNIQAQGVQ